MRKPRETAWLSLVVVVIGACGSLRSDPILDAGDRGVGGGKSETATGPVDAPANGETGDPGEGCVDGRQCVVSEMPCSVGALKCQGGVATCIATDRSQANGVVCGTDSVCLDGACIACAAGASCDVVGKPCRTGVLDCTGGKPQCTESGNASEGKSCGPGTVCKAGSCEACATGNACVPANPCHDGTLECSAGIATCNDSGKMVAPGAACGPGKVCSPAGECVTCGAGDVCKPSDACKLGRVECAAGTPSCVAAGNAPNGMPCGTGQVCSGGMCVACSAGMPCVPADPCHTGMLTCSSGQASCTDTGNSAPDGSSCGNNRVCAAGRCVACTAEAVCTPTNPCKVGKSSCTTGTMMCLETGNAPDGKTCGGSQVCVSGECKACVPGRPATCSGTMLVQCAAAGSLTMSPCNRGCAAGACCAGSTEAISGACATCGGLNRPCCKIAAPECDSGLACRNGACVVPCGDGPGQTCCENNVRPCVNNCNTTGNQTCRGGRYSACSVANVACCGPQACTNNCGRSGTRACNNGTLGACSVANVACCGPQACTNNCGQAGTRACNNGTLAGSCSGDVTDTECCGGDRVSCMSGALVTCRAGRRTAMNCPSQACEGNACAPCGGSVGAFCCSGNDPCGASLTPLICNVATNRCVQCGIVATPCCGGPRTVPSGSFSPIAGGCIDGSTCEEHVGSGFSCDD